LHQELQEAISKLNSYFGGEETQGSLALNQDDIGVCASLSLKFKMSIVLACFDVSMIQALDEFLLWNWLQKLWYFLTLLLIVGRKGRSYLLILLRLNQLTMETVDVSIFYALRKNDF
jgi:hypothetical protein